MSEGSAKHGRTRDQPLTEGDAVAACSRRRVRAREVTAMLLPTTLVGSYPQPVWLIDQGKLSKQVPRVRAQDLWLIDPDGSRPPRTTPRCLPFAIRSARASTSSPTASSGARAIPIASPPRSRYRSRQSRQNPQPHRRVFNPCRGWWDRSGASIRSRCATWSFCAPTRSGTIKMTVPGPFTMSAQCQDDFYGDGERLALDYAAAVNAEIKDLFAAGADIVQIDEPWMQSRPEEARQYGAQGARPRARRRRRDDGGAHLLRLCRGGEG